MSYGRWWMDSLVKKGTFIIAEAGVNHNGSLAKALELVDIAKWAKADAVKFQAFSTSKLILPGTKLANYQKNNTISSDQFRMLKKLELSPNDFEKISRKCKDLKIEFMATPFDNQYVDFLLDLGMNIIKISSGDLTNKPLLEHIGLKNHPIILSTGMSTINEISESLKVIRNINKDISINLSNQKIFLLHCTSNYPANFNEINLKAMQTLKEKFSLDVGYSDHSIGLLSSSTAVAMGAKIIEKHFTLDKKSHGPDHSASLNPDELKKLIKQIRLIEKILGNKTKKPSKKEEENIKIVRRSLVSNKRILKGEVIKRNYIECLRPGTGISPMDINKVIGKIAKIDIERGSLIQWDNIS